MIKKAVMVHPNFLTPEECRNLRALIGRDDTHDEMEGEGGKKCDYAVVYQDSIIGKAIIGRILEQARLDNESNYQFDPTLECEIESYVNRYDSANGDHRGWHVDGVLGDDEEYNLRKLSVAIQLSDPSEYTGGELRFMAYHQPDEDMSQQGTMMVFPAFEWHRVTPVESGVRYSFVSFLFGIAFR